MNYEQIEAHIAQKCAEVSQAANGDFCSIKIEADCLNGKVRVRPIVYTSNLGHYGNTESGPQPKNLDDCIAWVTTNGGPRLAKEKRDLAATLIAQAEALEAQL
jgi:hypothetical protein